MDLSSETAYEWHNLLREEDGHRAGEISSSLQTIETTVGEDYHTAKMDSYAQMIHDIKEKQELMSAKSNINRLQKEIAHHKVITKQLREKLASAKMSIERYKIQRDEERKLSEKNVDELAELKKKFSILRIKNKKLSENELKKDRVIFQHQKELAQFSKHVKKADVELEEMRESIGRTTHANEELLNEIKRLTKSTYEEGVALAKDDSRKDRNILHLRTELAQFSKYANTVNTELEHTKAIVKETRGENERLLREVEELKEENHQQSNDIAQAESKYVEITSKVLEEKAKYIEYMHNKNQQLQNESKDLKETIEIIETEQSRKDHVIQQLQKELSQFSKYAEVAATELENINQLIENADQLVRENRQMKSRVTTQAKDICVLQEERDRCKLISKKLRAHNNVLRKELGDIMTHIKNNTFGVSKSLYSNDHINFIDDGVMKNFNSDYLD